MSVRLGAGGAFFRVSSCETYDSVTRAARARSRCSSPSSSNRSRITNATSTVRSPRTVRSLTDRGPYHDGSRPALSDEGRGLVVEQAQPVLQVRLHGSRDDSALERVGERRRLTDERRAVLAAPLPRTDRWLVRAGLVARRDLVEGRDGNLVVLNCPNSTPLYYNCQVEEAKCK